MSVNEASGRPNQRRRTRKDLLQAAARLIKQGRTPTLDEVAAEALVSRATAYRYFPSIEALLIEAPLDGAVPDAEDLFRDASPDDPVARLERVDTVLEEVVRANEAPLRMMLAQSMHRAIRGDAANDLPARQNRRTPLIEAALAPVRGQFKPAALKNLSRTLALVDDSKAHSGKNSMNFHGGANPAMITKALPMGTNKLYVRGWFFMSRSLGATASTSANHETMIGIRGESGSASNEVRFGEIKGALGTNEVPSDNISPKMDLWNKGPTIPGNTWVCIEVAFIGDKTPNELHAWHNGTEVHSITAGNQWQNGTMPDTWLNGKFVEVILGWHSFSSSTADIWLDDLVLSTSPIGCS